MAKGGPVPRPVAAALGAVLAFWLAGAFGALGFLHESQSPMAMLTGPYLMLALMAVPVVIAALAVLDLSHRAATLRRGRDARR